MPGAGLRATAMALETLGAAGPATLIAVAEHLLEIERENPRRWFGFGGEAKALNAKAALLLGRALRRRKREPAESAGC
jgi:hypothetical protein